MLVKTNIGIVCIAWKHHWINKKTNKEYSKRYTKCFIKLQKEEGYDTLVTSTAKCYKDPLTNTKDSYSKCLGRKLSLQRAIADFNNDPATPILLDRDSRTAIWEAYRNNTKCGFTIKQEKQPQEELEVHE